MNRPKERQWLTFFLKDQKCVHNHKHIFLLHLQILLLQGQFNTLHAAGKPLFKVPYKATP